MTSDPIGDVQFDRTRDAVADLGLDPTGAEPIDDRLDDALQEGTKVEFPAGEYRITRRVRLADRTALVGTAGTRSEVRFVPPRGKSFQWVNFNNSAGIRLRDFTIDRRADYETSVGMGGNIKRNFRLENIEYDGWTPSGPQLFASNVTDPDGVAIVDGLYRTGPTQFQRYPKSSLDIWSGRGHQGTLYLRNIEIHNGSESGIYTGKGDGDYIIEDGYFKNAVHTAIRTAGEGSAIRGCTVVMDTDDWDSRNDLVQETWHDEETPRPQLNRGIWCQTADREFTGPLIEDCDVIVRNTEQGLAGVHINSDTGGARLRDVRVRVDDAKVIPIYAKAPTEEAGEPLEMDLDGVHVSGTEWRRGDDDEFGALTIEQRPGSTVTRSHIAGGGNGIIGDGIGVAKTTVDVDGTSEYAGDGGGPELAEPSEPAVRPSERERMSQTRDTADAVATSLSELRDVLSKATEGDLIWVDSGVDVTVSETLTVPPGVTVASGRGNGGAARLSIDDEGTLLTLGQGARLTGVEIQGPHERYRDWDGYPCGTGVDVVGEGVEVDNCEIHGFAYTGVNAHDDTHVHHCDIHHNPQNGLGYGVLVDVGHVTIEDCEFDYNRHSVAAKEGPAGYTIENCWFGPETIHHVVDHHGPTTDSTIVIRGNTFEATHKIDGGGFYDAGAPTEAIRLRKGGTAGETIIEDNQFAHSEPDPCGGAGEAILLGDGSGSEWDERNATVRANQFGRGGPDDDSESQPTMENVRDHGAAGDGQHDDTAAIRKAADAAGQGGTVYFPAGEYLVGESDRIALGYPSDGSWDGIKWKGEGADEVLITMAGGQTKTHFVFHLDGTNGAAFEGLTVDGNKHEQSNDSIGLCILCEGRGTFEMRDCRIKRAQNGNLKFNGSMDARLIRSHFQNAGYVWNGGHGLSANQEGQTTTVMRYCLFSDNQGADIDVGKDRSGNEQTVLVEWSILRDSYRGSGKFNTSNAISTFRHCLMRGNADTEIPIKANPDDPGIGTIVLEDCIIDGGKFPGIDLPRPGRLELSNVTLQNVGLEGHRGGAGIHSDGITVDAERVSIHGTDSQVNFIESASGSLQELIHGGQSAGADTGIVQSRTQGDPLVPEVPTEADVGPGGSSSPPADDGGTTAPTAPEDRPETTTLRVQGTGVKTDYCVETDGEVFRTDDTEQWDTVQDGTADGWVTAENDVDTFEISGEPTRIRFRQGRATVTFNGADVTPPPGDYVEMRSSEETSGGTPYSFVVEGAAAPGANANDNDSVTENDDGTVTVDGQGGWGGRDDFYVDGPIVDADWDATKWTLYRNETEVPLDELQSDSGGESDDDVPSPTSGEYHLAADGSDSAAGTADDPFRTFAPLSEDGAHELSGGDTVVVHGRVPITKEETLVCWDADGVTIRGEGGGELDCTDYSGTVDDRPVLWFGRSEGVVVQDLEIHHAPASPIKFEDVATDATYPFTSIEAMHVGGHVLNCELHHCGLPLRWGKGRGGVAERVESYAHFGPTDESRGSVVGGDADGIQFTAGPDDAESHLGGAVIDCSMHHNSDDGLDLYRAMGIVIADSVAYANGFTEDGESAGEAAGKGFKLGGTDSDFDTGGCLLVNSAAWGNGGVGIGFNGANLANDVWNCTALENRQKQGGGYDIECYSTNGPSASTVTDSTFYNTLAKGGINYFGLSLADDEVERCNFDRHGTIRPEWSAFTFESTARDGTQTPERPDAFLRPAADSDAIGGGVATPTETAAGTHHGHTAALAVAGTPNMGAYPDHAGDDSENGGQSGGETDDSGGNDGNAGGIEAHGITFDRRKNAVEDLGLDPTGSEVCDAKLAGVGGGTLVEFPAGEYKIASPWIRSENVGLVAKDGADVQFVCEPTEKDWSLLMKTGGDHVLSGIDIDRTAGGSNVVIFAREGDFYIGDVQLDGVLEGGAEGLSVSVESSEGVGTLERVVARDGGAFDTGSHGVFVGQSHAGRLDVVDCEVCNFPDNGLYASSPGYVGSYQGSETSDRGNGEVHVTGGVYKNNNIANIRIGSTNSSVVGATVKNETDPSGATWETREHDIMPRSGTEPEPVVNARGIWLANRSGLLVEDCDIVMETGRSSGAIVVDSAAGGATVRNTRVHVQSEEVLRVVDAYAPMDGLSKTGLTFEGVSLTGYGGSMGAAVRVRDRPETEFSGVCLDVETGDGIVFEDGEGLVRDSSISCLGAQVSGGEFANITAADSCPLPSGVSEDWRDSTGEVIPVEVSDPARATGWGFGKVGELVEHPKQEALPESIDEHRSGWVHGSIQRGWSVKFGVEGKIVAGDWPEGARVVVGEQVVQDGSGE